MEMIAAAKLRRAQEQVLNARPYFERMWDSLGLILHTLQAEGVELSGGAGGLETEGGADGHCLLVFTSDRGAWRGGYNAAVIRRAEAFFCRRTPRPKWSLWAARLEIISGAAGKPF